MCSVPIETFERFRLVRDGRGLLCYGCRNFQRRNETEQRHPDGNLALNRSELLFQRWQTYDLLRAPRSGANHGWPKPRRRDRQSKEHGQGRFRHYNPSPSHPVSVVGRVLVKLPCQEIGKSGANLGA